VDPVPDPLLLRKSGSAGNQTRDLRACSQELRRLDHRSGRIITYVQQSLSRELCLKSKCFCFLTRWMLEIPITNEILVWMLRRVALGRTDVSDELIASIIRVTRIGELGTLAVTSNRRFVFLRSVHRLLVRLTFLVRTFLSPWRWRR
jgi:hypothetical protein